jgi:tetratricopeptide (TPR) repeat protein
MPRTTPALAVRIASASVLAAALGVSLALAASSPPSTPKGGTSGGAAQTGEKSWRELYDQGVDLAKSEQYAEARKIFEQLEAQQPKSPEVLNMLAFTQRKTGDLDTALGNYQKALKIKPKFPQAREYLAEAYLQAAMREAETLKGYGDDGSAELTKVADAMQEAASHLESNRSKDGKSNVKW